MKKLIAIAVAVLIYSTSSAQENKIEGKGDVGIGTKTPNAKLDVDGGSIRVSHSPNQHLELSQNKYNNGTAIINSAAAVGDLKFQLSGSDKMILKRNGNIGIGISNPNAKLDVDGGSIRVSHSKNQYLELSQNKNNNGTAIINSAAAIGDLKFQMSGSDKMTLKRNGALGLGTNQPASKLHIRSGDVFVQSGALIIGKSESSIYGKIKSKTLMSGGPTGPGGLRTLISADNGTNYQDAFFIGKNANIGIGTTDPKSKLSVEGRIWAKEIKCSLKDAADWVFEEDYDLRSLEEVEEFVNENKHLPDVPSADDFRADDMNIAEMNNTLLQKVEELTLYLIEQNKTIKHQLETNDTQSSLIQKQSELISDLQSQIDEIK